MKTFTVHARFIMQDQSGAEVENKFVELTKSIDGLTLQEVVVQREEDCCGNFCCG